MERAVDGLAGRPAVRRSRRTSTTPSKLQGKLLLIVGELDTNVPPESTLPVVDALIKADKDFDLLVVPGAGHGSGGAYGTRRHAGLLRPPPARRRAAGPEQGRHAVRKESFGTRFPAGTKGAKGASFCVSVLAPLLVRI